VDKYRNKSIKEKNMKKTLLFIAGLLTTGWGMAAVVNTGASIPASVTTTGLPTPPAPAVSGTASDTIVGNTPGDMVLLSLVQHVTAVSEITTNGTVKAEFLDGLVQFGHWNGDYIAALDGGFLGSTNPDSAGRFETTFGFHVHAISFVSKYFDISPSLQQTLDLIEATPRVSWDSDVHNWVWGYTFGARIPFQ
jgi:hypothetical protein